MKIVLGIFPLAGIPPLLHGGGVGHPPLPLVIFMWIVMISGVIVTIGLVSWVLLQMLQSANAGKAQATNESREEHQHKIMRVKW